MITNPLTQQVLINKEGKLKKAGMITAGTIGGALLGAAAGAKIARKLPWKVRDPNWLNRLWNKTRRAEKGLAYGGTTGAVVGGAAGAKVSSRKNKPGKSR